MGQRMLAYLKENADGRSEVVESLPTELTDEAVQEMDEFLRRAGKMGDNEEIAITEEI